MIIFERVRWCVVNEEEGYNRDDRIQQTLEMFLTDRRVTIDEITDSLNTSRGCVHQIMNKVFCKVTTHRFPRRLIMLTVSLGRFWTTALEREPPSTKYVQFATTVEISRRRKPCMITCDQHTTTYFVQMRY